MPDKRCSKCGITKPLSEYQRNKRYKDGYLSCRRVCRKIGDHYRVTRLLSAFFEALPLHEAAANGRFAAYRDEMIRQRGRKRIR